MSEVLLQGADQVRREGDRVGVALIAPAITISSDQSNIFHWSKPLISQPSIGMHGLSSGEVPRGEKMP
jgi:hypothetical protein